MKPPPRSFDFNLQSIEQDILSENQETRGSAMQTLLLQARKDASIHSQALDIFRRFFLNVPDSWTAISAARGIELLAGPEEGRWAWLSLLHHADPLIVSQVAASINHDSYVPVLLKILHQRSEIPVKASVMRALGRLKDAAAFAPIVKLLAAPELRIDAIQALEDLGDPRAIPCLEPLLADHTNAWPEDNHGGMLRISDLANAAIRKLRAHSAQNINGDLPGSNVAPLIPPNPRAPSRPRLPSSLPAYIPLIAALLEIPWIGAAIIGQLYFTGEFKPTPTQTRLLSAIAIIPAIIGLITGITIILSHRPPRLIDRIFLGTGFSLCGFIILWLGQELIHWENTMRTGRLEAFSDGVIAIIITIMVLELKAPHSPTIASLHPLIPVLLSYAFSFIFVGIYWNNHHHLFQITQRVNGRILWANLHLLFWLSLIPFTTDWLGETYFAPMPVALYGVVLLMSGVGYWILQYAILKLPGGNIVLAKAIGRDLKGKMSLVIYALAIAVSFFNRWIACGLYVLVAIIWLIPDPRIERALATTIEPMD